MQWIGNLQKKRKNTYRVEVDIVTPCAEERFQYDGAITREIAISWAISIAERRGVKRGDVIYCRIFDGAGIIVAGFNDVITMDKLGGNKVPVSVKKRRGKWRVVESATGRIAKTGKGTARDGGGHVSADKAKAQARAINAAK